ncbi:MAG: FKBP-type peptidyl-prolyl cis-trans isomerase [Methanobacteriota archaeon]|nr:MAG: FKBP-type peptidyl-prolyl cis-trans isomerase [Euryarchaeota archaeon]
MPVKKGDMVKVEYEGSLDDGTVFDSSEKQGEPIEFEVGAEQVIQGFDDAVMGMEEGEEKEFEIQPSDGYGDHNPEMVKEIAKESIPDSEEMMPGLMLVTTLPNGLQIPAVVVEVTEETVTIDLNHPLAGKVLHFKIKVVGIAS